MLCNKQFCHFSGLPLVGPLNFICTYGFFQFLYKQIVIFWNALLVMHPLSVQWERYAILLLIRSIKVSVCLAPFEVFKKNLFYASFLASGDFLEIFGVPWLVDASPNLGLYFHMAFSLCLSTCPNFSIL